MIKKICLFTTGFGFNRQAVLNYIEKICPKDIEIFLFTPKNHNESYYSKKIKILKTNCSKYSSFFELRQFCIKNNIDRIINLGVLPQEGFAMSFSSLFNKRDFICFQVGDPIESFKISNKKYKIKSFFEALFFLPLSVLPKKILFCSKDIYENYKKNFSYLIKNLDYLPLTIDTKLFVPKDKKTARKKLGLP
ncbi:MAG: hypothetical protein Q7S33_03005, partial [Nanoarchaeota archaeon]|nr:hypothetical protein [Nanoarchaeota archaeon]